MLFQKRDDIEFLRGISILLVIFYHLKIPGFTNGFWGVDIFFVISGFLMANIAAKRSIKEFYLSRIKRLALPFLSINVLVLLYSFIFLLPSESLQVFEQATYSAVLSNNLYFWSLTDYYNLLYFTPLLHLWSIGVEFQFYLLAPFIFFLHKRNKVILLFIALGSFALCILFNLVSPKTSFFMMPLRFWEFYLGASLVLFKVKSFNHQNNAMLNSVFLTLFAFLLMVIFTFPVQESSRSLLFGHPSIGVLIVCLLTSLLIFFRIPNNFFYNIFPKTIVKIGNISFSLYLVHFPVIVFYNYEPFEPAILGYNSFVDLFFITLLILIFSTAFYFFIEKNLSFAINGFKPLLFSLSGLVILIIAFSNITQNVHSAKMHIYNASEQRNVFRCGKLFRLKNILEDSCFINDFKGSSNLLLMGNSHADAIKDDFAAIAQKNDVGILFPVLDETFSHSIEISSLVERVLEKGVEGVIFHYSNIFFNELKSSRLKELIASFTKKSIPVYLIAPIPFYDDKVPKILYERSLQGNQTKFSSLSQEEYIKSLDNFYVFSSAANIPLDYIFSPLEILCPNNFCLIADFDGIPFYFDESHLTRQGSIKLEPLFESIIDKHLSK